MKKLIPLFAIMTVVVFGAVIGVWLTNASASRASHEHQRTKVMTPPQGNHADAATERYEVSIRTPSTPRADLGLQDSHGVSVEAACSTCHTKRPANFENRTAQQLDVFHRGLTFKHGSLHCLSCHNPNDYDTLRLADGAAVAYADTMTLCAQCHASQVNDYQHGAHGGMNGHWDLTRGPRTRNHCIDCHDPHAPAFPHMKPTFKPFDRFLSDQPRGNPHE